jgi:PHP family Zn ribbon phosphoesterase
MSKVNLTYVEAFNLSSVMESVMEQKMSGSVAAKFVRLIKPFENLQKDYNSCIEKLSNNDQEEIIKLNNSVFAEFETLTEEDIKDIKLSPLDILRLQPVLASS